MAHSGPVHKVTIEFDPFGSARLEKEAASQDVTVEELVRHAVMYFFADLDAGRAAGQQLPRDASRAAQGPTDTA
jgi:hypothetical protein